MTVQVVTDSGADIPEQLATDLGIVVVPLTVSPDITGNWIVQSRTSLWAGVAG